MEMLEDDFIDLLQELRTAYGDMGLVPLLKKAARAAKEARHPLFVGRNLGSLDEVGLHWPKAYQMDSDEFLKFAQALTSLMTPQEIPTAQSKAGSAAPLLMEPLLTPLEARALLETYVDLPQTESTAVVAQQEPIQSKKLPEGTAPTPEALPQNNPDDGSGGPQQTPQMKESKAGGIT